MQPQEFPYWESDRTQPNGQSVQSALNSILSSQPLAHSQPVTQPQYHQPQPSPSPTPTTAITPGKPVTITIDTDAASIGITITPR